MPASGDVTGVTVLPVKFFGERPCGAECAAVRCCPPPSRHRGAQRPRDRVRDVQLQHVHFHAATATHRHTHGRVSSHRSTPTHSPAAVATPHAASTRVGARALQHAQQLCIVCGNVSDARVAAAASADRPPSTRRLCCDTQPRSPRAQPQQPLLAARTTATQMPWQSCESDAAARTLVADDPTLASHARTHEARESVTRRQHPPLTRCAVTLPRATPCTSLQSMLHHASPSSTPQRRCTATDTAAIQSLRARPAASHHSTQPYTCRRAYTVVACDVTAR
jgi:hypothetical protein